ncbi:hypothetical protein [Aminobacterium sp. EBM-42]|uniref:hypothetical protein n=1 Tax=Aminobacterium sp. EBM-42 TaxID=1918503 RepID=UPI002580FA6B|nr:hypothetical protein [Aminobacterium sp. EBM-42]
MTSEPGYFGSEADGRDALAALKTYKGQSEAWENAYGDLRSEILSYQKSAKEELKLLKEQMEVERRAWKKEIQVSQTKNTIYLLLALGIGYVAGN